MADNHVTFPTDDAPDEPGEAHLHVVGSEDYYLWVGPRDQKYAPHAFRACTSGARNDRITFLVAALYHLGRGRFDAAISAARVFIDDVDAEINPEYAASVRHPKRLQPHEQRDLLRLLAKAGSLQGRPMADYLRDHFDAERVQLIELLRAAEALAAAPVQAPIKDGPKGLQRWNEEQNERRQRVRKAIDAIMDPLAVATAEIVTKPKADPPSDKPIELGGRGVALTVYGTTGTDVRLRMKIGLAEAHVFLTRHVWERMGALKGWSSQNLPEPKTSTPRSLALLEGWWRAFEEGEPTPLRPDDGTLIGDLVVQTREFFYEPKVTDAGQADTSGVSLEGREGEKPPLTGSQRRLLAVSEQVAAEAGYEPGDSKTGDKPSWWRKALTMVSVLYAQGSGGVTGDDALTSLRDWLWAHPGATLEMFQDHVYGLIKRHEWMFHKSGCKMLGRVFAATFEWE